MAKAFAILEPLKQVLSASRELIISGQIFSSKLQGVFTLGDGCWLPNNAKQGGAGSVRLGFGRGTVPVVPVVISRKLRVRNRAIVIELLLASCFAAIRSTSVRWKKETQEPRKGGFSKGVFCRAKCHAEGKTYSRILGPAVHLALSAPQPREAYILQKHPSKTPLFLVPEFVDAILVPMWSCRMACKS